MSDQLITLEQASSDILAAAGYLAQFIKSSDGHAEAMKAVVPRYLERGEVDLAAELSNTVEDPFTRDRLLIQVAEKCAEIGDDEYALQLADAIEDVGMQSQARERIAIKKALSGDFDKASEVAEQILNPDYVYAEIAVGLAKSGRDEESGECLDRIELSAARASALQELSAWNREKGNADAGLALLDQGFDAAEEIEHGEERVRSMGEIANAYIDAGRTDLAVKAFEAAKEEAEVLTSLHRDAFLSGIAIGLLKAGNVELADESLDLVVDKTQVASGLLGFARIFWDKGQKEDALESLEEAYSITRSQRETEIRDSRASNALSGLIAQQYALFGKPERAIEIAQENRDPAEKANTLARMAQIFAQEGDTDAAEQSVRAIDDESSRVFAWIGLARAKANLGDNEQAIAALDEAVGLADDLPQLLLKTSAFETSAPLYDELGAADRSHETRRKTLETIATIRSESDRAVAMATLSDVYERTGLRPDENEREMIAAIMRTTLW